MWFSVLGPLQVRDGGSPLALGGPRQQSVLALLLLDTGRAVSTEQLITEIWGDDVPDRVRDSVYTYVSNLRHALGRERVFREDRGYRLHPLEADVIDAIVAEADLTEARRLVGVNPDEAIALIDDALAGWRGRPYEGFEDLPSIAPEAARLEELRLSAVEDRIEAELRTGRMPEVGAVEKLTTTHPYRERFWELLARTLYRAGRQAEALQALNRLRRVLVADLGIDPSPAIVRLEERILLQDPALEARRPPPTNLTAPLTSFIGRHEELDETERLIHEHRLVTLTGPGGVGKTRLAMEIAGRLAGNFPDGVWLVDLTPVAESGGVVDAIAAGLHIPVAPAHGALRSLIDHLRPRTALLVLDNCEHVVDGAGEAAVLLLSRAPALRLLATSRRALDRSGEVLASLGGLVTAGGDEAADAERLFEARAGAVRAGFRLDATTRRDVASVCRHLDGLPLAIELAAARVGALSPAEIDGYLRDRFELLGDRPAERPAHRSLQASLDWSYDLLPAEEQAGFDSLGSFEGAFAIDAAGAVMDQPSAPAVAERLRSLVGASLVETLPGTRSRYRLLETMRLYTRLHLAETGAWLATLERHDHHYHGRCRELRDQVFGRHRTSARALVEAELAEYEAAFDRFLDAGDFEAALEMAWPLGHVWLYAGKLGRGVDRLERLVAGSQGIGGRARADALTAAAWLISFAQQYDCAAEWAAEAIGIYRSIDDAQGLAYALSRSGHFAFSVGEVPRALEELEESLDICRRVGFEDGTAWPLTLLAQARLWAGDESDEVRLMLEEGRRRFIAIGDTYGQMHANMFIPNVGHQSVATTIRYAEESMRLVDRPGADPLIRPVALHNLAFSVWQAGDRDRAQALNRASARHALEMGAVVSSGMAFLQAGLFAAQSGDPERAALLDGAGDRFFVMQMPPFYTRQLQPGVDAATDALGDTRFEELHDRGAAMDVATATELVVRT
jgi:predicted ATPase/DNA-binding SARP family transcriptional activator